MLKKAVFIFVCALFFPPIVYAADTISQLKRDIETTEREIKKLSGGKVNLVKTITLTEDKLAKQKRMI
ncbi:MAG: hypothetical protein LBD73_02480, partial [Deferribacteraceae bacterium]|nr:hypothetical protein [Deferribacteraceae bacterium]